MKKSFLGSIVAAVLVCFASVATAGTNTWTGIGNFTYSNFVRPDPTNVSTIYAGVRNPFRIVKTTDGGATWNAILTDNTYEFLDLAVDPLSPNTLYTVNENQVNFGIALYKSTDGGATWNVRNLGLTTARVFSLTIDPVTPATVYALTSNSSGIVIFKTTNGGDTWSSISNATVTKLVIDPSNPQVLYGLSVNANQLLKSTDGGATWTTMFVPVAGTPSAMVLDPLAPGTIYAAGHLAGGVYKSMDGGSTWVSTNATLLNVPDYPSSSGVWNLRIVPGPTPALFAISYQSCVYRSLDGGVTWTLASSGLPQLSGASSCYASLLDLSNSTAAPAMLFVSRAGTGAAVLSYTHDASLLTPTCSLNASPSTIAEGGSSTLSALCSPTPTSYVWSINTGFSSSASGGTVSPTQTTTYTVQGVNANGSSNVASVTVLAPSPRLVNISTRAKVLTGNEVLIGGFIVQGSTPKTIVVRARGPSLAAPNTLANPTLRLMSGQTILRINDDWQSATNAAELQASGFAPSHSLESAVMITVNPGAYTAIVSGSDGGTGMGIVEVFEVDHPENPLVNISARGSVLTGDDVMIGGFIIQGSAPQTVVVRARGPSLAQLGLTGTLANPMLRLYTGSTLIETNDNWVDAANAAQVQSSGFAPANSQESAILITLNPGAYTAIMSGVGNTTGIGLVEVFAVP